MIDYGTSLRSVYKPQFWPRATMNDDPVLLSMGCEQDSYVIFNGWSINSC